MIRIGTVCLTLLFSLTTPAQLAPADPAGDLAAADSGPPDARTQAQLLVREGMALVARFNQDKTQHATAIVDAAIVFGKARDLLQAAGDADALAEVQANLFWCKKQMDLDALKDYVARKGSEGAQAVQAMAAVAATKVPDSEAPAYLARAQKFATANPDDNLQIAIRFLEVAERFPGTQEGTEANKRALDAQQALMKQMQAAADAARQTLFTKQATVGAGAIPVPTPEAQQAALALIRKAYAKGYAKRDMPGRRRLARTLLDESEKNTSDPPAYHQMIVEAVRLAGEAEDYLMLFEGCEKLAAKFQGLDAKAEKQAALRKLSSKATAAAILKLLDAPADPAANLTAGKWFAYVGRRWEEALPMLALSGDPGYVQIAQMERANPTAAAEQVQVADAWYDLGRKASGRDDKSGAWSRALTWYQRAAPGVEGLAKDRLVQRTAEIEKALPVDMDNLDWNNLTAAQWDRLKGMEMVVPANQARVDAGVVLAAGQKVRVVPHPTETWKMTIYGDGVRIFGYRGYKPVQYRLPTPQGLDPGALQSWLDNGPRSNGGILVGPGRLLLGAGPSSWIIQDRSGQIRVKLLPVADED